MKGFLFPNILVIFVALAGIKIIEGFSVANYLDYPYEQDDANYNDYPQWSEDDADGVRENGGQRREQQAPNAGRSHRRPSRNRTGSGDYSDEGFDSLSFGSVNGFLGVIVDYLGVFDFLSESVEEIDFNDNVTPGNTTTERTSTSPRPVTDRTTEGSSTPKEPKASTTTVKPHRETTTVLPIQNNHTTTPRKP